MIRRPPRSTLDRSSAASDVYKRQDRDRARRSRLLGEVRPDAGPVRQADRRAPGHPARAGPDGQGARAVSYTHLRAHETVLDLVCRLLLATKKNTKKKKD